MGFAQKKLRLLLFLTRRIAHFGWAQWIRGLREREMSYVAMELAEHLPANIATIVDVGAHTGLVADALDFLYRPVRLWAVEPNPLLGQRIEPRLRGRRQFTLVRSCLGERSGEATLNVHDFDAASSLYACRAGHLASLGFSEGSKAMKVPMTTLGELLPSDLRVLDLLKLDCQGSELSVLKGAGERIHCIRWIYCEVSLELIYEGAHLFGELHAFLRRAGFGLRHMGGFSGDGRSIQWADALYENVNLTAG